MGGFIDGIMVGSGKKLLEWLKMAGNDLKWLDIAEMADISVNGWKWSYIARNG